ncbi:glycosyltransferase family 4 protein [Stutzerimonas chloritidismutans]|uniref:glycosyltransferase family 4 protein n=1 Tax=Stutzerimonas chloritidismutans TaxID=203192 RepID=UPI00384ADA53
MSTPIIIATVLRRTGETGVHTHYRTFIDWLEKSGQESPKLVTPYDRNRWLVYPVFALRRVFAPLSGSLSLWWYRYWHQLALFLNLKTILAHGRACVVYAQCPMSAQAALAARVSPAQRVVMIAHFNISEADEWAGKGVIARDGTLFKKIRRYEAQAIPRVDQLVFVSAFMQRNIHERIPQAATVNGKVIPNFISAPQREETQRAVSGDLICVGTLERRKNQHYALEIVAAARRSGHPLRLTLVGGGPDRPALSRAAKRLGIEDDVVFTGHVNNVTCLMTNHRACLHVSHMESFGIVLIEAMAQGLPVFASRVGGVVEVFRDGVEGRFIPLDNACMAARIIQDWMLEPEALRQAGIHARTRFTTHFETGRVAQELVDFLMPDANEPDLSLHPVAYIEPDHSIGAPVSTAE